MGEKINATCSICGNGYHLCMSCKDSMKLHPWKIHCCSADCYKTFQVVKGFSTGVYTKDEFKSKLQNIDLSNLENYREHIKSLIKDILKEEKVVEKTVVESIEKPEKSIETKIAAEEKQAAEKAIAFRKKNYKVNNEVEAE